MMTNHEKAAAIVTKWFTENVHGSAIGHDTPAYNHLVAIMPRLTDAIAAELDPVHPVTQERRDAATDSKK